MNIDSIKNYNMQKTTFGYKFPPEYTRSKIINFAIRKNGSSDEEYMEQVKHFLAKRFDASSIIKIQTPYINKFTDDVYEEFIKMCKEYNVPLKKKRPLIDIILRRKLTVNDFDFKNIDVNLGCYRGLYTSSEIMPGFRVYIKGISDISPKSEPISFSPCATSNYPFNSISGLQLLEMRIDSKMPAAFSKRLSSLILKNAEIMSSQKKATQVNNSLKKADRLLPDF